MSTKHRSESIRRSQRGVVEILAAVAVIVVIAAAIILIYEGHVNVQVNISP
jgi:hypothetical protein